MNTVESQNNQILVMLSTMKSWMETKQNTRVKVNLIKGSDIQIDNDRMIGAMYVNTGYIFSVSEIQTLNYIDVRGADETLGSKCKIQLKRKV